MSNKLENEKRELDILIGRGIEFEVVERRRVRGGWRQLFRWEWQDVTHRYHIKEPTLGVLDMLSAEYIKLEVDEGLLSEQPLLLSKQLVLRYAKVAARIVAIAVLGVECRDSRRLEELAKLFYHHVTPTKLAQLTDTIHLMSNYWSFTTSIRSMSGARTTAPHKEDDRIEGGG